MKTIEIWLSKTFKFRLALLLINALIGACSEPPEAPFARAGGPEDVIPYEALGSGKLSFTRDGSFFVIDADTKTSWGLKGVNYGGVLSPDGKYIAYQNFVRTNMEVSMYDIESDVFTTLAASPYGCFNPGWTADSKLALYQVSRYALLRQTINENAKSTVVNFKAGDNVTSIVSASIHDELIFSLNTFNHSGLGISGIFAINLYGTQLTQITTDSTSTARSPVWSPNGDAIAHLAYQVDIQHKADGDYVDFKTIDVILMDKHGENASTIASFQAEGNHTAILGVAPSLAWSPDGTKLALNMYEADGIHIYVMNADGSGLTKVTSAAGVKDGHLSWSN